MKPLRLSRGEVCRPGNMADVADRKTRDTGNVAHWQRGTLATWHTGNVAHWHTGIVADQETWRLDQQSHRVRSPSKISERGYGVTQC